MDLETSQSLAIFILPNTLSKKYLQDLKSAGAKNKFNIKDKFDSNEPFIVVSGISDYDKVAKCLDFKASNVTVVNLKWLTDSNKSGQLQDQTKKEYFIGSNKNNSGDRSISSSPVKRNETDFKLADYECQRSTPLKHQNEHLTKALEVLEEYAEFKGTEADMIRALAFRRSICALKCLPFKLTSVDHMKSIKFIGDHSRKIIEEIINYGYSEEIQSIESQEYYQTVKKFNSIYGCGAHIANRLYHLGYRTIDELRSAVRSDQLSKGVQSDLERMKYGLAYFDDLNQPISYDDGQTIFESIKDLVLNEVNNECQIELMGGFKREKPYGHDVDILITHPVLGKEKELLPHIIDILNKRGLVIYGKHDRASGHDWTRQASANKIDHFERFIAILKFSVSSESPSSKRVKLDEENERQVLRDVLKELDASKFKRNWIARRVDLIICPIDQHPFAVLGWTGSRQFVRSIRLYCARELGYKLSSHGLYDQKNNKMIQATTEKEIFDILKLNYLPASERHC